MEIDTKKRPWFWPAISCCIAIVCGTIGWFANDYAAFNNDKRAQIWQAYQESDDSFKVVESRLEPFIAVLTGDSELDPHLLELARSDLRLALQDLDNDIYQTEILLSDEYSVFENYRDSLIELRSAVYAFSSPHEGASELIESIDQLLMARNDYSERVASEIRDYEPVG